MIALILYIYKLRYTLNIRLKDNIMPIAKYIIIK